MEDGEPSQTAISTCRQRAVHFLWDDEPKVLRDSLAMGFCGARDEAQLLVERDAIRERLAREVGAAAATAFDKGLRAYLIMRSRYSEDLLQEAVARGVKQFVILGAGLDTTAYRRHELLRDVETFEVDHPASQACKLKRLAELRVNVPKNLTFVPVDLLHQSLANALAASAFRRDIPSFFSCLGVTFYLTHEVVFEALRTVAALSRGSEIVFDYPAVDEKIAESDRRSIAALGKVVASIGEPYLSRYEPGSLMSNLRDMGFSEVDDLTADEANTRYFAGRRDGLRVTYGNVIRARI